MTKHANPQVHPQRFLKMQVDFRGGPWTPSGLSLPWCYALTRRINSAHRSSTGNVFSAGSGSNVVTTRETPMSRYASKDQH